MTSTTSINVGTADQLTVLYSYPNFDGDKRTLAQTIEHWFSQTLERDGAQALGVTAKVRVDGNSYYLDLTAPASGAAAVQGYATRLPKFLANGWAAWTGVVPSLRSANRWDPCPDLPAAAYHPWRFFMPHGMPMLNQKALLFFHYPPIRLLETNQDYLDDPVPKRCEELFTVNGVPDGDLMLFNTVMDATPIGAEDDQGSKKPCEPQPPAAKNPGCAKCTFDPAMGLIPIQFFHDYQKAQVSLLLNLSPTHAGYTVPVVVYGNHPLQTFNALYKTNLKNYAPAVVEIMPGLKTPVLGSMHPYVFYGDAQGFGDIGSGILTDPQDARTQMLKDLAVARWLKTMSDDPSQSVQDAWDAAKSFWNQAAQSGIVDALVQHQGSLFYSNKTSLTFEFKTPLSLPPPAAPASSSGSAAAQPAPAVKPTETAVVGARLAATVEAKARAATAGLKVIGDSGAPVDWWFIYKISQESTSHLTPPAKATGQEYLYFDSEMAAKAGAKPVLSSHKIDQSGALFDTFSQLFTGATKPNPNFGWYCYNDEDRLAPATADKPGGGGTGPSPCGHCKGALAYDLGSDTAFWLIHSVPLLPMTAAFSYPGTGLKMGQTMLCIQLANAAASKPIAELMFNAHGPNVHVASDLLTTAHDPANNFPHAPVTGVPKALGYVAGATATNDPRLNLMQNLNNSSTAKATPFAGQVPFISKGGQKFLAIAKNRAWGNPKFDQPAKDFYNVLVSTALNENIEVETWENAGPKIPPEQEAGETHSVENMKGVDLSPLGIPWSWTEAVDHAKLAISDRTNPADSDRWVCVGDINFTDTMESRGGGTVAFICEPLWQALNEVLSVATGTKPVAPRAKLTQATAAKPAAPAETKTP